MKTSLILASVCVAGLAACDSPTPPSYSAQDVQNISNEADRVFELPDTAIGDLPSGSVSYSGHAGGNVSGDADGSVIGDMTMSVNFAGGGITGTIDNLNLIDEDDVPSQLLGGALTISGSQNAGVLTATATGNLDAVGDESVRGSSSVSLNLSGNVLTDVNDGDTVAGQLSGSGTGDFDINVYDGGFFGSSN